MKTGLSFVYMLRCEKGQLYTGWTNDPPARLWAHKNGVGARYTCGFHASAFAYLEKQPDKSAGLRREAAIKKLPKAEKEALCAAWAQKMRPRLSFAGMDDVEDICQIDAWYLQSAPPALQWKADSAAQIHARLMQALSDGLCLLARDADGQCMGYVLACPRPSCASEYEVWICCAPEARGIGVGNALLGPALKALHQMGVWGVYGMAPKKSAALAALYQKNKFFCVGRFVPAIPKDGETLRMNIFYRELGKNGTSRSAIQPLLQTEKRLILAEETTD